MIGKLKGILTETEKNEGLIETASGVYYKVYLTPELLRHNAIGATVDIYTYLHVKEDALTLYGFEDKEKYTLFTMLLSVDGVGPKLAFAIISYAAADSIIDAVVASDQTFFNSISGVGKKTAQKILLELSGKFNAEYRFERSILTENDHMVVEALKTLGFDTKNIHAVLPELDGATSVETRIAHAIKLMTQRKNE